MTVEELIKLLSILPQNYTVAVRCRNSGGDYSDIDEDIRLYISKEYKNTVEL